MGDIASVKSNPNYNKNHAEITPIQSTQFGRMDNSVPMDMALQKMARNTHGSFSTLCDVLDQYNDTDFDYVLQLMGECRSGLTRIQRATAGNQPVISDKMRRIKEDVLSVVQNEFENSNGRRNEFNTNMAINILSDIQQEL